MKEREYLPKLSVVINTKNAEQTLESCLHSVEFADEIIVVDMKSTDSTVELAQTITPHVFTHPDVGFVEPARNFAIQKATGDWILILDADEEVPAALRHKIEEIVSDPAAADCYYLPRKNIIFGKWVKTGWWPDHVLRLFRTGSVEWSDEIHSIPITSGKVIELPATEELAIMHHNYASIEDYIARMNRYTSIEATQKKLTSNQEASIIEAFSQEFFTRLFLKKGIDEGMHGVSLSFLQSFYQVVVTLKSWEKAGFSQSRLAKPSVETALREWQRYTNYWLADWHVNHSQGLVQLFWRVRRKLMV